MRDEPSVPRVSFEIPVDRLTDDLYCTQLSDDLSLANPDGWSVLKATSKTGARLPKKPGLYMFVWNPQAVFSVDSSRRQIPFILYIGRAGDTSSANTIQSRYMGEYRNVVESNPEILWSQSETNSRDKRMKALLSLQPLEIWYLTIENRNLIAGLEKRLFNLYAPPLNSAGGKRLRPLKTVKAF
jgi:hypothetical protein